MSPGEENIKQSGARQPDHSILFLHGIDDFRFIRWIYPRYRYFNGVDRALESVELPVYFPELRRNGSIRDRAEQLLRFTERVPEPNIHFIAHSMGGLDARYLISQLDSSARVRSLRTIATPHRGTPIASWALETNGPIQWLICKFNMPGIADLTESACAKFNKENQDRADVDYFSFSGSRPVSEFPWLVRRFGELIADSAGENDFLVPVSSALWGKTATTIPVHHAEFVGWKLGNPKESKFDHIKFYRSLIEDIVKSIS